MRAKLRHLAANLVLLLGSLLACLLALEFVLFGILLKPDDVLANVSRNGVVRYQPNTQAIFRHPPAEIKTDRLHVPKNLVLRFFEGKIHATFPTRAGPVDHMRGNRGFPGSRRP